MNTQYSEYSDKSTCWPDIENIKTQLVYREPTHGYRKVEVMLSTCCNRDCLHSTFYNAPGSFGPQCHQFKIFLTTYFQCYFIFSKLQCHHGLLILFLVIRDCPCIVLCSWASNEGSRRVHNYWSRRSTRAFSKLKAPTSIFRFHRHYAKWFSMIVKSLRTFVWSSIV